MKSGFSNPKGELVLVTGATGYIGGRLVPELLAAGYRVRVMARQPRHLADREWFDRVEIVYGDPSDLETLPPALSMVTVAYYLIHSLGAGATFESLDRINAHNFAEAASASEVERVIYLGGLYPKEAKLSPHLKSRKEVGDILLSSSVPTTVLRAAVIIGSGSLSFEMLRYLTERLPIMITPNWVDSRIQPIAVRDVLHYLVKSAKMPPEINRGFDIGGPDVLTYREMMVLYAKASGYKPRRIISLPFMTPSLSSQWVGLVTPVPKKIAQALMESLVNEVICKEHDISQYIPDPEGGLIDFCTAVDLALQRIQDGRVTTRWASASHIGAPSDPLPTDPDWAGGGLYVDERVRMVKCAPAQLWHIIEGIGGEHGWYSWRLGWWTRGVLDRFVGGPGLRRGRRDAFDLVIGDALDWWRVEDLEENHLLRLRAEMRLPGLAWLELIIEKDDQGQTLFRQRALFHPHGPAGGLYWVMIKPFHGLVFGGMQRNIARAAEHAPTQIPQ
ncbi:MAG TPA: SDR family oxidoreductase [Candidatus Paceibacterota bacterium]|nr:SDR family oxidoreductase [Candidatus Paceibacterota bacterium]